MRLCIVSLCFLNAGIDIIINGFVILLLGDISLIQHVIQNFLTSLGILFRVLNGIVFGRSLGDTCDGSTLRKVQIPYILIEILAGCCLHTVSACTKVDGIQVILKDYIFIIDLLLNLNGKVLLLKLTRKSFNLGGLVGPVGEDIVLQKLLGNGTCTL